MARPTSAVAVAAKAKAIGSSAANAKAIGSAAANAKAIGRATAAAKELQEGGNLIRDEQVRLQDDLDWCPTSQSEHELEHVSV